MRSRKVKEPYVAITKAFTESKSLEKALDMLPIDKVIEKGVVHPIDEKEYVCVYIYRPLQDIHKCCHTLYSYTLIIFLYLFAISSYNFCR